MIGEKRYVIVDLDGTISDSRHREHLALERQWDEFHEKASLDLPKDDVRWLLDFISGNKIGFDPYVVILTGRNERYRPLTEAWLMNNNIHYDELLMRPDRDFTPDHELKPAMLTEFAINAGYQHPVECVLFVLDDRDKVVEAFRNMGIPCWQVQVGGY